MVTNRVDFEGQTMIASLKFNWYLTHSTKFFLKILLKKLKPTHIVVAVALFQVQQTLKVIELKLIEKKWLENVLKAVEKINDCQW